MGHGVGTQGAPLHKKKAKKKKSAGKPKIKACREEPESVIREAREG